MRDYQSGHQEAISELFQRYKVRVLNFCARLLGNRTEAEEVASEVFLALVTQRHRYDPTRTFSTWMYTIARNHCVSRMRLSRRVRPLQWFGGGEPETDTPWDPPDPQAPIRDTLIREEVAACVQRAVSRLPYEQREAIVLQHYHDCSYVQISEILGCSLAKVRILIFRGKERLRADLAQLAKEASR